MIVRPFVNPIKFCPTLFRSFKHFLTSSDLSARVRMRCSISCFVPCSEYTANQINSVSIEAGQTKSVSYTIKVPHKEDSGERSIGTVEVRDSTSNTILSSKPIIQKTKLLSITWKRGQKMKSILVSRLIEFIFRKTVMGLLFLQALETTPLSIN